MNFWLYFACLSLDFGDVWCKRSANNAEEDCDLPINRRREGRTFLMGVNEITHWPVCRETVRRSEGRGRLCKAAVPRHREHHLQSSCTDKPCCWAHISNKPTLVTTRVVDSLHHTCCEVQQSCLLLAKSWVHISENEYSELFRDFLLHRTPQGLQPLRIKLNTKFLQRTSRCV